MAEKVVLLKNFLSCHVCSETFRDPVSLSCNHSFCSSCLQEFWEQAGNKNCPVCKRKSSKENIFVNFTLKELADSFAGRRKPGSSETDKGQKKKFTMVCSKHKEEPKLFCEDEQKAVCPVCEFSVHQSHKVVPLQQAVNDLKEQLKSDLKSLQDKRNKYKQVENTYNKMIQHSKNQWLFTEKQIKAEFNKLHQLDYESGQVSFYTYKDNFTEKLFPYFSIGDAVDAKTPDIKICPTEMRVSAEA